MTTNKDEHLEIQSQSIFGRKNYNQVAENHMIQSQATKIEDRRNLEREIEAVEFEYQKLLVAQRVNKQREEKRLGRTLTEQEQAEVDYNTKVPTTIEFLLRIYE